MPTDLLLLVKHARPEVDASRPPATWVLGPDGQAASLRLAERLRPYAVGLVVSSVEPKAAATGRIVAGALDVPWQTGHDLHEHVRPAARFAPPEEFDASVRRFFSSPASVVFGAESADAAHERFSGAVDALQRTHSGVRLCVVAHGTVISLLLGRRYGVDEWSTWKALGTPSFVVVDRRAKRVIDVVPSV